MPKIKMFKAIADAINEEMQRDDNVFIAGEDVGQWGGVWGTSPGLHEKYGAMRAVDTPISEGGIVGLAVGSAITGLRPIVEMMYVDFIAYAMDQVVNQAAKLRLMSGNRLTIPMVIRAPQGNGTHEAAQHSQFLEAWFAHAPGLKVVMPYTVSDAKGLLKSAIRDNNPVLFLEHRCLYARGGNVPEGECIVPIGKANVLKEGGDITIISYSRMLDVVLDAAEKVAPEISVEVIDLRTLVPLDIELLVRSVRKTGRVIVVHEAPVRCGFGAEVVRRLTKECFSDLKSAPQVVGGKNIPIPYSPGLEKTTTPQTSQLIEVIEEVCKSREISKDILNRINLYHDE